MQVLPQDYRALTWTLAHRTQRSSQEGHALKFAANFLIVRPPMRPSLFPSALLGLG